MTEITITTTVDVDVCCSECGKTLEADVTYCRYGDPTHISVDPCPDCKGGAA